ncbi:MAG: methyltransferase domain-containing protein [Gammaproteobacteria bacterium]|nr:methyltransferase domain-containing protein [Gammaproteobacteria bacterium]MCP5137710.1 methyltransferase domain-containing protein [Gammaproteobacteria bacterium]
MPDYNEIKQYYDAYGAHYDDERLSPYYRMVTAMEMATLLPHIAGKRTLEIGCGTGLILAQVARHSALSWGIDLSSGMLEEAREKGLNVKENNAREIDFPDASFDVVYSFKVLAHIPDIDEVINEIHRVLTPSGRVVLEFYNPFSIKHLNNLLARAPEKIYTRYDSRTDIAALLGERFHIEKFHGVRIATPLAGLINDGWRGRLFTRVERFLSGTFMQRVAGYMVVVASKKGN